MAATFGCDRSPPAPADAVPATAAAPAETPAEWAGDPSARAAQAISAALAERDPYTRARKLAELLPTLGPEAVPAVRGQLARSARLRAPEFELLLLFWTQREPEAASKWSVSLAPRYKAAAIHTAVESWAAADPEAARGFVDALDARTGSTVLEAARIALARGWFRADRAGLEAHMRSLEPTPAREQLVATYALSLLEADGSDALIAWAEAIPEQDEAYKRSAYFHTSAALAALAPDAALPWCERHCEGPYAVGMRQVVAVARVNNGEPGGLVLDWIASAPATPTNQDTLVAVYRVLAGRDPDAARAWLEPKLADPAAPAWVGRLYGLYALLLAGSSPAEAITWAGRVEPEAQRNALLVQIARAWRAQDEAAADAWLAGSPLPEPARALVREPSPAGAARAPAQ